MAAVAIIHTEIAVDQLTEGGLYDQKWPAPPVSEIDIKIVDIKSMSVGHQFDIKSTYLECLLAPGMRQILNR